MEEDEVDDDDHKGAEKRKSKETRSPPPPAPKKNEKKEKKVPPRRWPPRSIWKHHGNPTRATATEYIIEIEMIFSLSLSLETLSSDTSDVSASVGGRNEYGRIHINMAAASGSFRALIITRTVLEPCRARPCLFFFLVCFDFDWKRSIFGDGILIARSPK